MQPAVDPPWGEVLAILRVIRGWKQLRLAEAAGTSASAISRYEAGERTVPLDRLIAAMGFPPHLPRRTLSFLRCVRAAREAQLESGRGALPLQIEVLAADVGIWIEKLIRSAFLETPLMERAAPEPQGAHPVSQEVPKARPSGGFAHPTSGATAARKENFGQALVVLRIARRWSREELVAALGTPEETIANWERGKASPEVASLQQAAETMGFPPGVLGRTLAFVRSVQAACESYRGAGEGSFRGQVEDFAAREAERLEDLSRSLFARFARATRHLASRQEAPALWARFQGCSEAGQRDLVREAAEFQSSGFCELLCEESRKAASDSAKRARYLAELAVMAAERTAGDEPWHCRLRGYAGVHLANSQRVGGGELPAATQTFGAAEELWTAGAAADPDLLNAARVLHLKASLRRAQRRVPEALALLDEALAADRWGERPSLLISKAKAVEELGDYEAAIGWLRQAARLIDGERDPLSWFNVLVSLSGNLCHLRQFAEAKQLLREVQALAQKLGNQLDLLRVSWQRGKIAAGLGRTGEAIAIFERVRSAFAKQGNAYDAALVTLELAEVYAFMGRTAEVKAMARKSAPIFEAQGVHREARRALALCRRAAEHERLSAKLLRGVIAYLYRARHDPHLRFEAAA
jgi:transcriptional regulator with XRE-family HTH domain/tetratricopeptide (TPR) repeat protein